MANKEVKDSGYFMLRMTEYYMLDSDNEQALHGLKWACWEQRKHYNVLGRGYTKTRTNVISKPHNSYLPHHTYLFTPLENASEPLHCVIISL